MSPPVFGWSSDDKRTDGREHNHAVTMQYPWMELPTPKGAQQRNTGPGMGLVPIGREPDESWLAPTAHRDCRREVMDKCFVVSHAALAVLVC